MSELLWQSKFQDRRGFSGWHGNYSLLICRSTVSESKYGNHEVWQKKMGEHI